MKASRIIALAALAQQPGIKRTDLQRHDISVPGRELIQVLLEFAPGVSMLPEWGKLTSSDTSASTARSSKRRLRTRAFP